MTNHNKARLTVRNMTYGFSDRPNFFRRLNLDMHAGQCWGIIGPNGAGKSTLMRLLAGQRTPSSGEVTLDGFPIGDLPARQRGKRVAFLPQQLESNLPLAAGDVVLMGRYPHRRFGLFEDALDREIAKQVMASTQTSQFTERPLFTLSGGEAQRVHIAAALAQEPSILLLDEPTASLDLFHQLSIFEILRSLSANENLLVVAITHDINLAARYCTHVLLLDDGRIAAAGSPSEVLQPNILQTVYRVQLATIQESAGQGTWVVPIRPLPHDSSVSSVPSNAAERGEHP